MSRTQKEYKVIDFPALNAEETAVLERLEKMPESEIDKSDIPSSDLNSHGGFYYFQSLRIPKQDIHTKIDKDNLEWLKKDGKGYQTRLNSVIRWARMNNCPVSEL